MVPFANVVGLTGRQVVPGPGVRRTTPVSRVTNFLGQVTKQLRWYFVLRKVSELIGIISSILKKSDRFTEVKEDL